MGRPELPPPEAWTEEYMHSIGSCSGPPECPVCNVEGEDHVLPDLDEGEIAAHVGGFCWDDCRLCQAGLDGRGDDVEE